MALPALSAPIARELGTSGGFPSSSPLSTIEQGVDKLFDKRKGDAIGGGIRGGTGGEGEGAHGGATKLAGFLESLTARQEP